MSKIVNWGHWLVAAIFAANGVLTYGSELSEALTNALKTQASFYPVYLNAIECVAFLLCAWGIMKWRLWAHILGILLSGIELAILLFAAFVGSLVDYDPRVWALPAVIFSVLIWLLLPAVWTEHLRRNQIA